MLQQLKQLHAEYKTWSSQSNVAGGLGMIAGMIGGIPLLVIMPHFYKPKTFLGLLAVLSLGVVTAILFMISVFLVQKMRGMTVNHQSQLSEY